MKSFTALLIGCLVGLGGGYLIWGSSSATEELPRLDGGNFPAVAEVEWDDGDSGKIRFEGYPFDLDFRLKDWDAPETGGVGSAVGAAKCETERSLGKAAEEFVERKTASKTVTITAAHGRDRTPRKRHLLDLAVDGEDLATLGAASGHLRSWRHEGSKEKEDRPNWCD